MAERNGNGWGVKVVGVVVTALVTMGLTMAFTMPARQAVSESSLVDVRDDVRELKAWRAQVTENLSGQLATLNAELKHLREAVDELKVLVRK